MTREEAKEKLYLEWQKFLENNIDYAGISEAYKMAFRALEQEPSHDAISRQAVMDCFKKWQPYMATRLWDFEQELSKLPSVKQEPCEDAISRQAVQDYIAKYLSQYLYNDVREAVEVIDEYIGALPSVKPQEKTGYWRHYENMLICSECGAEFYDDIMEYCGDDVPKCCLNCGARMVEPQERGEK